MLKVYVAGPYEAETSTRKYLNIHAAIAYGTRLALQRCAPLVPHLTYYLDQQARAQGREIVRETWLAIDLAWLEAADVMLVLDHSPGVDAEIDFCLARGIPVVHVSDWDGLADG